MKKPHPPTRPPKTGAAPFAPGEIFFSRTDGRGVIAAFNDVFLRIADYGAGDLIEDYAAAIPVEGCYLGWQDSLQLLGLLVEADVPG